MSVKFQDPPEEPPRRQLKWQPLCEKAMKAPGRWARIATTRNSYQAANAVRSLRSRKVKYPEGRWEFRNHGIEVYARYLGEA